MAYGLKDSCNTFVYDRSTGKPFLYADYLNEATISITGEAVFAKAKGINKISFEGAKTGTFKMATEIFEFKYLALVLGGKLSKGNADIAKRYVNKIDSEKKITLPDRAKAGSISVFKLDKDNKTLLEEVAVMPAISEVGGKTVLTWSTGSIPTSADILGVFYLKEVTNATKINISDAVNSQSFKIRGITAIRNEFGEDELFQFTIFNCKPQVNAEITLSAENVASFEATFDILLDENNDLVEMVMLTDEDAGIASLSFATEELQKAVTRKAA